MEILEGHNKFYVNDAQGNRVAEIVLFPPANTSALSNIPMLISLKGGRGETAGGEGSGKNAP